MIAMKYGECVDISEGEKGFADLVQFETEGALRSRNRLNVWIQAKYI